MKSTIAVALCLAGAALQIQAQDKPALKDQRDRASYSIGVNIGSDLKQQALDVNPEALAAGLKDAVSGGKLLLTEKEREDALSAFEKQMQAKLVEQTEKNKKDGEAFLAKNKKEKGVVTVDKGLQYKILREGKGAKPKASDMVKVNYRGSFINGTEFDSSFKGGSKDGDPISFPLNGVIPGWTQALQLMGVGSKWQLFIPSDLAYGEPGRGPIPPNSTLIFEVDLIEIVNPDLPKPIK